MNVADLRQHLADLSKLLASSKATTVAKDLEAICKGLVPFDSESLKGFADFLVKAHTYSTTGEVPVGTGKRGSTGGKTKPAPKPSVDLEAIKNEIRTLYDQAAGATDARIDEAIGKLQGLKKKDDVIAVAAVVGYKPASKDSITKIIAAIKQWILEARGTAKRTELLDRPTPAELPPATTQAPQHPVT